MSGPRLVSVRLGRTSCGGRSATRCGDLHRSREEARAADSLHLRNAPARRLRLRPQRIGCPHRREHLHWEGGGSQLSAHRRLSMVPKFMSADVASTCLRHPVTPLESLCLLLTDEEKSQTPFAVLTGDTLFIGDVGRPDLSKTYTPPQLAGMLYDSLHKS